MPRDTSSSSATPLPIELLDRVLSGAATPAERARVERWMGESPEHAAAVAALRAMDVGASMPRFAPPPVESLQAPARRTADPRVGRWRSASRLRASVWSVAGGALLGAALIVAGWRLGVRAGAGTRAAGAVSTYTTGRGQRAAITLPDGSRVVLNVASRLDVPADYLDGNRSVTLDGEALFTVERHPRAPFAVRAGRSTARVLGTSFVMRHYADDSVATVAVRDGRVAVRDVVLTAGQQARVRDGAPVRTEAARAAQFSFAAGTLTLDHIRLGDAVADLSRWYDVDVRLGRPALAALELTGEFSAGSVSDLQSILALTYDVRVVRSGRVLTLYPK